MKQYIAIFAAVSLMTSAVAFAAPPKAKKPTKATKIAKVTDVWVCPMTLEASSKAHEAGTPAVVDGKRVHFCCGGCPDAFAKLSPAEKKSKVAAAVKKAAELSKKS